MGCCRPNRHLYFKHVYGSHDYKNTNLHYRKIGFAIKNIQGMLNMFYILSEKSRLSFSGRGGRAKQSVRTTTAPPPSSFRLPLILQYNSMRLDMLAYIINDNLINSNWIFGATYLYTFCWWIKINKTCSSVHLIL